MNKFRVEYLVGKTPPESSLYLNGHAYNNVAYRMMPQTRDFPDLESAQGFFAELENSWETEEKLAKDRVKPHVISIKLLELQDGPEYRKWVVLKKSEYDDWFDANKNRFLVKPENDMEEPEGDLQEVDGNQTIRDLFGGMGQDDKDLFAGIENQFNDSGVDAWISRNVSTPEKIFVMGGFVSDSSQWLHVEEIMKRNGYTQTRTGSDYVMYEKQQIAMQEKKKKQVTIKESELRKVVEANVKRKLMEMEGGLLDPDVRQDQIDMAYAEKAQQDNGMNNLSKVGEPTNEGRKVVVKESELREYVAKHVRKALSEEVDMG